jgi:hypothetical protein
MVNKHNNFFSRGRDSVVGIPTTLWAERFGIRTLASPRDFIFSTSVRGLGAHPSSCAMGIGSFPALKRLGRDVDLSPPSSAELKKWIQLYPTPSLYLQWYVTRKPFLYNLLYAQMEITETKKKSNERRPELFSDALQTAINIETSQIIMSR